MPKLFSTFHILKILKLRGFHFVSQRGSHIKYRKFGSPTLTVIIPAERKEIPIGTFRSIVKQAQLSVKDFD